MTDEERLKIIVLRAKNYNFLQITKMVDFPQAEISKVLQDATESGELDQWRMRYSPSWRTTLYRHYNNKGELLYVGISIVPGERQESHRKSAPWWQQVANIRLEHFSTPIEAKIAEDKAIATEDPVYNILGRKRRKKGEFYNPQEILGYFAPSKLDGSRTK